MAVTVKKQKKSKVLVQDGNVADVEKSVNVETVKAGTKFVIAVKGVGMGRGRYVMPDGGLDPWRFHAKLFETRAEADEQLPLVQDELADGAFARVASFAKAWHETPEEAAAVQAAKKTAAKKKAVETDDDETDEGDSE
jgi:hypothetical protein